MSILSRLRRLEKRLPQGRRVNRIIETIVDPPKEFGGEPIPVAVVRESIGSDATVSEVWYAPDIPDPLPESIDVAAVERFRSSPPWAFPS
jgi:hypothetical protein